MESKDQEEQGNVSTHSSSFICSLGDDELIEFIKKLSQDRKLKLTNQPDHDETDIDTDADDGVETELDTDDDSQHPQRFSVAPEDQPSSSVALRVSPREELLLTSTDPANSSDVVMGSITLAQKDDQEQDKPVEELLFGDYETYFKEKKLKQLQADEEYRQWDEERRLKQGLYALTYPPIFRGCTMHVNGRTDPDISQLHKMIVLHGGAFLHYLGAKGNATHIIASKLTPRKHLEFRNYKVVKPEWVVESIALQKLLHWKDYLVVNVEYGQKKLDLQREPIVEPQELALEQIRETLPLDGRGIVDAKHPDFLKYFFSKSRLHHLSAWKADLKYEFLQKAIKKLVRSPISTPVHSKTIFHVDFDCFFATVSALSNPSVDNAKDPIAVTHGSGSADIASCNYVARKFGVKNGMWVSRARQLCPNLICLDYNFDEYDRISRIFFQIMVDLNCNSVLPLSVDEVLLDVSSLCAQGKVAAMDLARQIREEVYAKTRCTVSVGAAPNVLLAKLALRKCKPDGICCVSDTDDVEEFLDNVLVRDFPGIGYSVTSKLSEEFQKDSITASFLRTIEQQKLINLFGIKTGTKLYEYARGIDNTDINVANNPADYSRKSVSIDINWGIRFDNVMQVDQFLLNCAKEMHSRLLKIKMVGSSVTLKLARRSAEAPIEPAKFLGMGQCDFYSKSARLGVATREIGLISSECKSLYRILNVPVPDLRGVSIQITHLVDDEVMEREAQNQRKLPFAKIDRDQFLAENEKSTILKVVPASVLPLPRSEDISQYDIPSDIDSSVLRALPDDIRERVERERLFKNEAVTAVPNQSQIDWEIFKQLPKSIQRELQDELKRRDIPVLNKPDTRQSTPHKRRASPDKKFELQPIFAKNKDDPQMIRVISPSKKQSPRKRFKNNNDIEIDLQLFDIDQEAFEELPSFAKRDLVEDLKRELQLQESSIDQLEKNILDDLEDQEKPKRTIQLTEILFNEMVDSPARPIFQGQTGFDEVKQVIIEWIRSSIPCGGPSEETYINFMTYFTRLLDFSLGNCINYIKIMKSSINIEKKLLSLDDASDGVRRWNELLEKLQLIVDNKCLESNIMYKI